MKVNFRTVGVTALRLFGSTVRGEHRPDSDIDLLASFDPSRRLSLLDLAGIHARLAALPGNPIDLVEEGTLRPHVRGPVEAEAVSAF